jgi:hypothetical protein
MQATSLDPCHPARGFPPPWTVEDHNDACFIVKEGTATRLRMRITRKSHVTEFISLKKLALS